MGNDFDCGMDDGASQADLSTSETADQGLSHATVSWVYT